MNSDSGDLGNLHEKDSKNISCRYIRYFIKAKESQELRNYLGNVKVSSVAYIR